MALSKLVFKPGINRDQTNYASEGGWYESQLVRFRSGFPEKIGGWTVQNFTKLQGAARSVFSWAATTGSHQIAVGTNEKIYIVVGTLTYDITPIRQTFITTGTNNCFATTNGSKDVTVTIVGHGAINGAWVTFSGATVVGGIPDTELNQEFQVSNVTSNTFEITVTTTATSTVTAGGGTAIIAEFQINPGYVNVTAGYGWGTGTWGRGTWGSSSTVPIFYNAQIVFFQNFNDDLIFNIRDGSIYYWVYNSSFTGRAVLLSSISGAAAVPQQVGQIQFTSSGHLLALGCTTYDPGAAGPDYTGYYDALLLRWSDVNADIGPRPEYWVPELTNTSGFFRIQAGTRLITSVNTRQETLVWTDTALYSIQFLGTVEVFGQQQMSAHVSIAGPNVVVGANNITYWMGNDKFYIYSGRVDTLPCTLRQYIFDDMNKRQSQLFFSGSNVEFNEIIWFYCSENSDEINRYVIYNFTESLWYYGQLSRTAWADTKFTDNPVALNDGWLYNHESGTDDGQPLGAAPLPMNAYIQSADIDITDGEQFMLTRRIIPDVNFTNSELANPVTGVPTVPEVTMTIGVRNFPGASSSTSNASDLSTNRHIITTATIDQYTNQVFVRARGRQMNFKISSNNIGTQWQLGMPRIDARPDGTRS